MSERRKRNPLPARIRWVLYDPMDGLDLMSVDAGVQSIEDVRRIRRMIQRAPARIKALGRPDGKPIGLRTLKTNTWRVYR